MSKADQRKWNERYRANAYGARTHPSALLAEWLPKLASPGDQPHALDVACGTGRNALYLARHGWQVDALDISAVALQQLTAAAATTGLPVRCVEVDLEHAGWPPDLAMTDDYDLAIMFRYTNLSLLETLLRVLKPCGYLIVEEHLATDADVVGPRNPAFRVAPGALREAAVGADVIAYREGLVDDPDGRTAALAQLVARKAGGGRYAGHR